MAIESRLVQLVLLNVSDQTTRARLNSGTPGASTSTCRGVLLGQQSGMKLDITNSFELPRENASPDFLQKRVEQCEKEQTGASSYARIFQRGKT